MNSSVLRHTDRFTRDKMIQGVMQRTQSNGTSFMTRPTTDTWEAYCNSPDNISIAVNDQLSPTDRKRKRQEYYDYPASTLMMLPESSNISQPGKPRRQLKGGETQMAEVMALVDSQMHQEREMRRLGQISYRQKKEDCAQQLEEETRQLRQEIEKLEKRRKFAVAAVPSNKTLWNVTVDYFRQFRYGIREPAAIQGIQSCPQLDFLRATMAPDVIFNAGRGVESIMRNWKYFALWFQDVEMELSGLMKGGKDSLVASVTTRFTITKHSLTTVFPHLCNKEARSHTGALLVSKLVDRRIVMRGTTRFDWDSRNGLVTSVIGESDMLTPMLDILGNLEDVSKVFEKSLISLTPYRGPYRATRQGHYVNDR